MRKFVVTVNGKSYEVEVDEIAQDGQVLKAPAISQAPSQPPKKEVPAQKPQSTSGGEGSIKVSAPMPGTILDIKVNGGDSVSKGQVLMILEAMKMENEIVAPQDGTVASVKAAKGSSVNAGDILITMD